MDDVPAGGEERPPVREVPRVLNPGHRRCGREAEFGGIDILIHSIAFSREVTKPLIDTSRKAYHEAMGISAYSLVSMVRAAAPHMANRPGRRRAWSG
jgi:NAD(P)-dependent dehydrogenase (short-subunit alcohol dehydrogenase family)